MRNLKLTISYDGTNYCGWQVQPNGLTIQEVLGGAIQKMTGEKVSLAASGRTDAGVHAIAQVANFRTDKGISCDGFLKGLNSLLPRDIAVTAVEDVGLDFHAQRDAISKDYRYLILNGDVELPLLQGRVWFVRGGLNITAIGEALKYCLGVHDFSAFCAADDCNESKVRKVFEADVKEGSESLTGFGLVVIDIRGNGFLKHMVRNIVGTLVDVGRGKIDSEIFRHILESRDRKRAGITAPAHGLYLLKVVYESSSGSSSGGGSVLGGGV